MSDISSRVKTTLSLVNLLIALCILSACQPTASVTQTAVINATQTATFQAETANPTPFQFITNTPAVCTDTAGSVVEKNIPSTMMLNAVNVKVYLPPCYNSSSSKEYPVLYMLHGMSSTNDQWIRIGLISTMDDLLSQKAILPFIIVLPNEENTNIEGYDSNYGEALIKDVIPYIDENFNVCEGRACRAIGGLSRGGNWAVHLGYSYPQQFIAIGAHSSPLFYGEMGQIYKSVSELSSPTELPVIYIDVGNKDEDKNEVFTFVNNLYELGAPYQFAEFQGYHDEKYWSAHVQDYLIWYANQFMANAVEP